MITDDHLKALGKVTVNWSELSSCLEACVWKVTGTNEYGMILTTHMSFPQLCHALMALLKEAYPVDDSEDNCEFIAQSDALIKRIQKLATKRNEYAHSRWYDVHYGTETLAAYDKISARGRFRGEAILIAAQDIEATADDIKNASAEFWQLMYEKGIEF